MAWTLVPPYGSSWDWPDRIWKEAWQEVVDAINERSQFLGLDDLATDITDCTPMDPADPPVTKLRLSMLTEMRDAIETLAPSFRDGRARGDGAAWTVANLLTAATGSSSWSTVTGGTIVKTSHIEDLYNCLNLLSWRAVSPGTTVKQKRQGTGGSDVAWAAAYTAFQLDFWSGGEANDGSDMVMYWHGGGQAGGDVGITGVIHGVNTDANGKLYLEVTDNGDSTFDLDFYKDAGLTSLVATAAGGVAITAPATVTEANSSGLGGSIHVTGPNLADDADIECSIVETHSDSRLVGWVGQSHAPGGGSTYQKIQDRWSCPSIAFTTPNPTQAIVDTQFRWKGVYDGAHLPWMLCEAANWGGATQNINSILSAWDLLDVATVAKNTTVYYSLIAQDEREDTDDYDPADSDGSTQGSYVEQAELLIEIGFDFL